jgi:hypothetical protein
MGSHTHWAMARTLWKRAPWWRFVVLSSLLLTLVMGLFPPRRNTGPAQPALDSASYRPPARTDSSPPLSVPPTPAMQAVASTPPVTQAKPPAPPAARTASLALARPDGSDIGPSGIDPALMGRTYHGKIQMSGFELSLPPGEWAMLASSTAHLIKHPENAGMQYFLGRIEHARLTGAIEVIALHSPDQSGFEAPGTCVSPQTIYTRKEEMTVFARQACWTIHLVFTSGMQQWADKAAKMSNIYRMAGGDLSAKGVTYPQEMIAVHFFRSEPWGLLEAAYHFSPEAERIHSNTVPTIQDSDWFVDNLQRYPEKLAYTEKLKQWGETNWPLFQTAFAAGTPTDLDNNRIAAVAKRAAATAGGDVAQEPLPKILRVRYLSPRNSREFDVTDRFKSNCATAGAGCRVRCDTQLSGTDPDFGTQKVCVIQYQCSSKPVQELRIQEGTNFAAPSCSPVVDSAASKTSDAQRCAIEKFGKWRRDQSSPPSADAMNGEIKEVNAQCGSTLEFSVGAPVASSP